MAGTTKEELIARLILSTKRKKRNFSIVEIANDIEALNTMAGSLGEVSKLIGISTGMLKQFLSVSKLPEPLQELIQERKIDSVALVFLLSKFSNEDAFILANEAVKGNINSDQLKVLLPYRKRHNNEDLLQLIEKMRGSKNIKVSVIKLPLDIIKKTPDQIAMILTQIVGTQNFHSVEKNGDHLDIKIYKEGEKNLRNEARGKKLTLSELMITLIK